MITIINKTKSVIALENGIEIKTEDATVFLNWKVIDQIAEVSEPHYFTEVVKEVAVMNDQKKIN